MKSVPYFKSEAMGKVVLGIILVVVVIIMIKFLKEIYCSNIHIYNSLKYQISKLTIIVYIISLFCVCPYLTPFYMKETALNYADDHLICRELARVLY